MKPTAPPCRVAFATYCDDVRREEGNKLSLMGVYNGVLMVESMPIHIAKLACVISIRTPRSQPFEKLRFSIVRDETEIFAQEIEVAKIVFSMDMNLPGSLEPYILVSSVAQFVPFEISRETALRALVETESETIRAGALFITKLPVA